MALQSLFRAVKGAEKLKAYRLGKLRTVDRCAGGGDGAQTAAGRYRAIELQNVNTTSGKRWGKVLLYLLRNASPEMLWSAAQRIGDAVRAETVAFEDVYIQVTVSLGGHVQHAAPGLHWETLLASADAALYEVKHEGRDRTVLSAACHNELTPAVL